MNKDILNEPFQFFFSGCEPDIYYQITTKETDTILLTYMYAQKKGKKFMEERLANTPNAKIFVDSGAHTFLADEETYKDKPIEYFEDYLKGYIKFAKENKDHIFAIVELDIAKIVGHEKVAEWRRNVFEKLTREEGIQVVYVWHIEDGDKEWERMCKRYPYIGVTFLEGIEASKILTNMFSVAKKYGTRIHGFGISGHQSLMQYPFFSCDSSTWLTGSQFGELNWFDGKKMFRLKKSEWKKLYKTKIIRMGGNWNLLEREDPYEMIRLNVLTFIKFRDYVRKRLANKAYWIGMPIVSPPKDSPKEENYNPLDNIPSKDWFEGDMEDVLDVAEILRIDTRLTKDEVVKYIKGYYAFCNEDVEPEDWVSHEDMYDFLDAFGDTEVNTITKAKKVLKTYFMENIKGIRDDLADLKKKTGVELIGKEREEYIEDPAYTKVEVPLKEVEEAIKLLSPPEDSNSMPEVDAYNEELAKNGLELIKEDGKPLKAYRKVRKSRKLLSKAVPGITCDVCYKGQDCPMYKEGYVCAFDKEFKKFDCRDVVDVQDAMYGMLNASLERMQRAMFFEKQDGGVPDPVVTDLIERNMKYLSKLQDLVAYGKQIHVERKTITEDGKVETTETIKANPQQGGLLSQLFGGMENTRASVNEARKEMDKETIDL